MEPGSQRSDLTSSRRRARRSSRGALAAGRRGRRARRGTDGAAREAGRWQEPGRRILEHAASARATAGDREDESSALVPGRPSSRGSGPRPRRRDRPAPRALPSPRQRASVTASPILRPSATTSPRPSDAHSRARISTTPISTWTTTGTSPTASTSASFSVSLTPDPSRAHASSFRCLSVPRAARRRRASRRRPRPLRRGCKEHGAREDAARARRGAAMLPAARRPPAGAGADLRGGRAAWLRRRSRARGAPRRARRSSRVQGAAGVASAARGTRRRAPKASSFTITVRDASTSSPPADAEVALPARARAPAARTRSPRPACEPPRRREDDRGDRAREQVPGLAWGAHPEAERGGARAHERPLRARAPPRRSVAREPSGASLAPTRTPILLAARRRAAELSHSLDEDLHPRLGQRGERLGDPFSVAAKAPPRAAQRPCRAATFACDRVGRAPRVAGASPAARPGGLVVSLTASSCARVQ